VIEALRRVLSVDSTRAPLSDDVDFFQRDRSFRAEVEVVLGDLGPALTQQFFDQLEFWDLEHSSLIEVLDDMDALNDPGVEPVVRLCYRAEWSQNDEVARHWVDYPKGSDPGAGDYHYVRRADREALPFFTSGRGARPLSLATRAALRRLIEEAPGADFATHLEALLEQIRDAAESFGESAQLQAALGQVVAPGRLPLDVESTDVNDLVRFAPEGGVIGAILRSLSATADLGDGAGFLPLERHGSTVSALLAVCEVVALGGVGIVAIDDLGEDIDAATTRHLAAVVRKQARQAWITTRRAPAAEAFRAGELVRLCFDDAGNRLAFTGSEPENREERMFMRHFALQVLPAVAARALIVLEGPHDRASYRVVAERLFGNRGVPLPASRRIAFADASAAGGGGGSSAIPKLAAGARGLGFFVAAIVDGDKDEGVVQAVVDSADLVIRLPEGFAVERAILDGLSDEEIRQGFADVDVVLPVDLATVAGSDLEDVAIALLKQRGGVHSQFLDGLPPTAHPALASGVLEAAVNGVLARQRGLVQL
jgi:hypothetical protein